MKKRMRDWLEKKDTGLVIVEACIVFPIMFFVIFFIIYLGNIYYQIAQVDDCVKRAAVKGAQCVVNPYQYDMVQHGEIPTEIKDVEPYRYIFGELPGASISEIERKIGDDLLTELEQKTHTFFIKMSPEIVNKGKKIAEFNNYVIYSTFQVQVDYELRFPIRFIFLDKPVVMRMQARAEVPVNDTPEFIRNVDMVADLFAGTKADKAVKDAFTKVNNFLEAFKGSDGNSEGGPLSITANPGIIAGGGGETSTPEPGKTSEETATASPTPVQSPESTGGGTIIIPILPEPTSTPAATPTITTTPEPEAGDKKDDDKPELQLTRAQERNIKKLNNIIQHNLKDTDFSGTLADLQGNPIPNNNGGYWDHLTEMKQSYVALLDVKKGLEGSLKNPNLDPNVRKFLQENLDNANFYIKKIEKLFDPFGGIGKYVQ